jgi:hypothetical protein
MCAKNHFYKHFTEILLSPHGRISFGTHNLGRPMLIVLSTNQKDYYAFRRLIRWLIVYPAIPHPLSVNPITHVPIGVY